MNKFEQLIEYVINDEEQKAKELFHDIVVEKSRQIYENIMAEEAEEELDEAAEQELDEAEEELDEAEEELDEGMGGDAADSLIDEVEMEEESDMNMEAEGDEEGEEEFEIGVSDEGSSEEPATKDDIMNLEDKLDQLMAEFEDLMGGDDMGNGDDFAADEGGDAIEMDDTDEMEPGMMEAVSLKAAPKPVTAEGGDGKAGPVAFNSGATGMAGKPVHATGTEAKGRPAPSTKDLISDFQNKAGSSMKDQKAANKPVTAQASGVNTRTPFPKG
jgi:hypothetical protein